AACVASPPATDQPDDIVTDLLQRVTARGVNVPADVAISIEADIRRDWGGDRPYIAKVGEAGRVERTRRENAIRADHQRGAHVGAIARKWGISIRHVQRILKSV